MHCSCNSACSHNPLLMCVLPTTTTSVISRHLRKHNIFTQDSFVDHLQRAFVSTHAKPRNVEVIDWVWDFDAWFEPHLDSAYGGMSNYKSFRLLKQAALGEEQQDDRGDVSTVLQAKRYMTSDKATYFPPTPPHAQSSESVLRALQLQFEQLCMAATSAGGQLLDVSQLREGWAKAVSGGRVPPHGERPNPVPAAGTAGETDRLPLPPAVVGAAGSPLLVCRVLFTEPEVSNLKPAPFKQLGLWDSENENVNVPKKLLDWKKKVFFFAGKASSSRRRYAAVTNNGPLLRWVILVCVARSLTILWTLWRAHSSTTVLGEKCSSKGPTLLPIFQSLRWWILKTALWRRLDQWHWGTQK